MKNRSVPAEHDQEIGLSAQVSDRVTGLHPCERGRIHFHQDWQLEAIEFRLELVSQFGDAALTRVGNQADFRRTHMKNSWLPSAPVICERTRPMTLWPALRTKSRILFCAFSCSAGSRTMPP